MVIQYVEQDVSDYWLIEQYCRQMHYDLVVTGPVDGRQMLEGYTPDIMIVDVTAHTAQQAHDFVVTVRQMGYDGPILAVSGCSAPITLKLMQQAGCDTVLLKPYSAGQLGAMLTSGLGVQAFTANQ
jgi:DNA-binding response OmpR family regulator